MYSRRFYNTDRAQRSRSAPAPQSTLERARVTEKTEKSERNDTDTFPKWAVYIPVTDGTPNAPRRYLDPRDFLPEKEFFEENRSFGQNDGETSVYPEESPMPPTPTVDVSENEQTGHDLPPDENVYGKMGEISSSVRNMTLEDMMLTGLLMLGSSGDYDDEIMLILGLILMIGA